MKVSNSDEREPVISVTENEIRMNEGMSRGMDMAEIHVHHTDGKCTKFALSMRMNKNGRAMVEVEAQYRDGSPIRRKTTGFKQ